MPRFKRSYSYSRNRTLSVKQLWLKRTLTRFGMPHFVKRNLLVDMDLPSVCPESGIKLNYGGAEYRTPDNSYPSLQAVDPTQPAEPGNLKVVALKSLSKRYRGPRQHVG